MNDHAGLTSAILAAVVDQVRTMDPVLTTDIADKLHEIAADAALYALAAGSGSVRAAALMETLGNRLRVLHATLAGRGQDRIADAIVTGFTVAARVAAALL